MPETHEAFKKLPMACSPTLFSSAESFEMTAKRKRPRVEPEGYWPMLINSTSKIRGLFGGIVGLGLFAP